MTTYLNMSNAFFNQENYDKTIEKATKSLEIKKTIKGLYRRAKAYAAKKNFSKTCEDLKQAIMLDTEDPFDIQRELVKYEQHAKAAEVESTKKMMGFLLKDEKTS